MKIYEYFLIFIPLVLGFLTSFLCRTGKSTGKTLKFRPPPVVFSIVWPILYILMGLSWVYSSRENATVSHVFYAILTILLCLWLVFYSCLKNKLAGVFILLACIACSLACFGIGNYISKIMLSPLVAWLIFATLMNSFEVQNS